MSGISERNPGVVERPVQPEVAKAAPQREPETVPALYQAPDWRIAAAVVCVVIALALAAFLIVLASLS